MGSGRRRHCETRRTHGQRERHELRRGAGEGRQPLYLQSVGRRAAHRARDRGARRLDTARHRACPRSRHRQVPAARRHRHGRRRGDRAGDGGRAPRIPAGAARCGRRISRPAFGQRRAAGRFGQRLPGDHRQRTHRETDTPELRLRLHGARPAAPRGREHRPRIAPHAAKSRRRPARHRRDGDVRRHALYQRGFRGRRGRARQAGCRMAPSATVMRRIRIPCRWCSPTV